MQNTPNKTLPKYLESQLEGGKLPAHLPGLHHAWLKQKREAALQRFLKCGLPSANDEDWRYTPLHAVEKHTLNTPQRGAVQFDARDYLAIKPCARVVFADGLLNTELSDLKNLPKGLSVTSVRKKLEVSGAELKDFFPKLHGHDTWHDLTYALFEDGAFIEVADGVKIEQPLEVIFFASPQTGPTAWHACNFIHIGENASLKIYKSKASNTPHTTFSTHLNHITLEEGATFDRLVLSQHAPHSLTFVHDDVLVKEGARFRKTAINIGGKIIRQKTTVTLTGENSYAALGGLTHASDESTTDVLTEMNHTVPNTQSAQIMRSLADKKGRAVFQGKITVDKAAQKTNADLNHQGLLLSDNAEIFAKPSLEINADDVKCSHGNTCGALDEQALFYLRSRGVPQTQAEQILQQAFIAELFDDFEETQRDKILQRIASAMGGSNVRM